MEKIIRSKKAFNRAKDRTVLEILEKTLYEIRKNKKKLLRLLKKETERALIEQIRAQLEMSVCDG